MFLPNILVTNYCNQNCFFCFAKDLMENGKIPHEMSICTYNQLLNKIKKSPYNVPIIKLFGGEPTLHTHFEELIKLALDKFPKVHIFTNGIIPLSKISFLKKYSSHIGFTININTPGFETSKQIRKHVVFLIKTLSKMSEVTLSVNISLDSQVEEMVDNYNKNRILDNIVSIRIGASNPIANKQNYYGFNDFKKIGRLTTLFIQKIKNNHPQIRFVLDCGFVPCMFTKKQIHYLTMVAPKSDWGCSIGNIDIDTDMTAFTCYPLSQLKQYRINMRNKSVKSVWAKLSIRQMLYQENLASPICKKCKYFGLGKNKCSGPCTAFLMNK